jgi:hypothetical protein
LSLIRPKSSYVIVSTVFPSHIMDEEQGREKLGRNNAEAKRATGHETEQSVRHGDGETLGRNKAEAKRATGHETDQSVRYGDGEIFRQRVGSLANQQIALWHRFNGKGKRRVGLLASLKAIALSSCKCSSGVSKFWTDL